MAISNQIVKATYQGDGAVVAFAIPHTVVVDDSTEVKVYIRDESASTITETLQTEGAGNDYTLTGAPDANSFHTTVTFNSAPAATDKVIVTRELPLTQVLDLATSSNYSPEALEQAYDRALGQIQQLNEILTRVPKLSITEQISEANMILPVTIPNNGIIGFSSDGTSLRFFTPDEILAASSGGTGVFDNITISGNEIESTDTNGDINLQPNGTGTVVVTTDLDVDNINVDGNTISSTDTNGNITLAPNGTGEVAITAPLVANHETTPSNPGAGSVKIYTKNDDVLYILNSAGTETAVGSGSSTFGNISIATNTISSTDTNGNIILDPNGTGEVESTAPFLIAHESTPANPASGKVKVYAKSDDSLYVLNSSGTETAIGSGGGSGPPFDNIDIDTNTISSTNTNGDINLSPDGTGSVVINTDLDVDNINIDGNTIISTDTNGDINITPNGTGTVVIDKDLDVDNLNLNGNTVSTTDTNGDLILSPNGTGSTESTAPLLLAHESTPANPSSGKVKLYSKTGSGIYVLDSSGTETQLASGATSDFNITSKTSTYTAVARDFVLASGTSFTITLPTASGIAGQMIGVKKTDSAVTGVFTIDGNSSETIDGATTVTINNEDETYLLVSDGTNWQVVHHYSGKKFTPVSVEAASNSSDVISGGNAEDIVWTEVSDSHGAWNGTQFTVPYAGRYQFSGCMSTSSAAATIYFFKDTGGGATQYRVVGNYPTANTIKQFSGTVDVDAGDVISIRTDAGLTLGASTVEHYLNITRLPLP